ncbi:MAG: hypothetical protein LBR93_09975 [Treponema sp.]|nr:hypothetical protein [Treponema sp.]
MMSGNDTVTIPGNLSFETMLDDVCGRLWDRKVSYSLRRIREMDAALAVLERELDEMILRGRAPSRRSGAGVSRDRPG